jgi:hypothetical protein
VTTFTQPAAGHIRPPIDGPAGALATSVIETVKHAAASAPRSQQRMAGPSELGTPCTRRLAYRMLDWDPKPNSDTDPWASIQGTAVHAWMAETYTRLNEELGRQRYLIEHRIFLPGGITGSTDLYDRDLHLNNDWKIVGPNRLRDYRRDGPGRQYRTQAHLYALGLQLAGEQPRDVAITFLPRGGRVDGLHVWSEPYDHHIAVEALKRWQALVTTHAFLDVEKYPERWALLPTADAYCTFCPWFLPGSPDLSQGCPGHNTRKEK